MVLVIGDSNCFISVDTVLNIVLLAIKSVNADQIDSSIFILSASKHNFFTQFWMQSGTVVALRIVFPEQFPVTVHGEHFAVHRAHAVDRPTFEITLLVTEEFIEGLCWRIAQIDENEPFPGRGVNPEQ